MQKNLIPLLQKPNYLESYNRLIQSCTKDGFFSQALNLYSSMFNSGFHGNTFTFPFLFKSCSNLGLLDHGKIIHGHVVLLGFHSNIFVRTSMIDMYAKCNGMLGARNLFDEMKERNLVSWNCIIHGYVKQNEIKEGIKLFNEMREAGFSTSTGTIVSLLSGFSKSNLDLKHGLCIYACGIKYGLDFSLKVCNSVLSMLVRFGLLNDAQIVFDEMTHKSIVSFTAISCGYVQKGDYNKVFELYNTMIDLGFRPDYVSSMNLISAGVQLGNLLVAGSIHALILQFGFNSEREILPPLINLYAKCGDIFSSRVVFDLARHKDIFLWTSMISGYVHNDLNSEAFALFESLLSSNVKPNSATICTILSSCASIGSIEMGTKIENYVKDNELESDLKIQTGLINMYCKCGSLEKARDIFDGILNKDLTVWSTMLNGYSCHGKGKETLDLFQKLLRENKIKPDEIIFTHILSVCSHCGLLDEGLNWFHKMQKEYCIKPTIEHFMCMITLLGKLGQLNIVLKFINQMPKNMRNQVWVPVFTALRENCDVKFGERVLREAEKLGIQDGGNYVLMANVKSIMGKWNEAKEFRGLISERGLVKKPGWSRIELNG